MKEAASFDFKTASPVPDSLPGKTTTTDKWKKNTFANKFARTVVSNFYRITFNIGLSGIVKYGQDYHDYAEGGMTFVAPSQIIGKCGYEVPDTWSMYTLLIHPGFL